MLGSCLSFSVPRTGTLSMVTQIPSDDPIAYVIARARCTVHNILYLLTVTSIGLAVYYQSLLSEHQLKARNWVGFFLPILTIMSDPRVNIIHELLTSVLFVAWSALSVEWYFAFSNANKLEPVHGICYAERVTFIPEDSACTALLWYICFGFCTALGFLIEFGICICLKYSEQIRKCIRRLCLCGATESSASENQESIPV